MAEVAKIDIDGVQWDIKDQNARDRIAALEEKTTVKITKKIDEQALKMNLVEINGEKFIQIYAEGIVWNEENGSILTNFTNDFGLNRTIRIMMSGLDSVLQKRFTCRMDIEREGNIKISPSTYNNNSELYKNSKIFGDAFIKISY